MTITVYSGHFAGEQGGPALGLLRDIRVLWTLEELGLPYSIRWFDVTKGEIKGPDYRSANPFGKVPAIHDEDGDLTLFESGAIGLYLAEKAGKLIPSDPGGKAAVNAWVHFAGATLDPVVFGYFGTLHFSADAPGLEWRQERFAAQAEDMLGTLDEILGQREVLVGESFTLGDIYMACVLRYTMGTPLIDGKENVRAYMGRAYARTACERALAVHLKGP